MVLSYLNINIWEYLKLINIFIVISNHTLNTRFIGLILSKSGFTVKLMKHKCQQFPFVWALSKMLNLIFGFKIHYSFSEKSFSKFYKVKISQDHYWPLIFPNHSVDFTLLCKLSITFEKVFIILCLLFYLSAEGFIQGI